MRWISDRRSAENGDISVLAIIETIVASVIAYLFYRWTNTLWHIGVAASLSPFLLLRTSRITEMSLRRAEKLYGIAIEDEAVKEHIDPINWENIGNILWLTTPIVISIIKFFATLVCCITHPIESIREIPRNWQRVVLCTDMGALPELIPTIEEVTDSSALNNLKSSIILKRLFDLPKTILNLPPKTIFNLPMTLFNELTKILSSQNKLWRKCWQLIILLVVAILIVPSTILANASTVILVVIPGLAYRYSVKSTALIWSPLLWVVRPASNPTDIKVTMDRITTRAIYKASRVYSAVVALAFAGKMYLWFNSGELQSGFVSPTALKAARAFIVPDQLPLWHVTSAFNAMASWGLYFISDYYYKDLKDGVEIPKNALSYTFLWLPLIMNVFTIYSLFCTVYITVQVTSTLDLPPLHAKLFPWW
jgi:hypothetical protein